MDDPLSRRAVKFVNSILVIAAVAVLVVAYWFAWRPLARHSGTITGGVAADVQVGYDSLGVPHIRAGSLEDALYAQGYVTAQDRLFKLALRRRLSPGQLSGIFAPQAPEAAQEPNAVSLCRPRGQLYSREFPCRRMSRDALMR